MTCFECGSTKNIHNHHVVPRSLGGTKTIPLCESCHGKAHGRKAFASHLTKIAMQHKKNRGEYTGGHVPYGYCLSKEGNLIPNPDEIKTMLLAKEKRAAGMTLRAISDELARAGIKARTGKPFYTSQIQRLLIGSADL